MNKQGEVGSEIGVFAYLFLLVIIGLGIVGGVYLFFGQGYDFREGESALLNYKIRECLLKEEIDSNFFLDEKIFFNKCRLNEKVVRDGNIIRICKNVKDCLSLKKGLIDIGSNFPACGFKGARENKELPLCVIESIKKGDEEFIVITGSKKNSRRVVI